ncbi:TPA: 30S ribosomal protein S5 [Candidatus Bathyarchaeota archaeon]|nr:30S ribosomal protein S5 [Candidatus Bathyarchaeota archaeon]
MGERSEAKDGWVPRTKLGEMVLSGQIVSLQDVFSQGLKIKEPEIVDALVPNLQQEVLGIGIVQKQTDAGERTRFRAIVAVGSEDGFVGVGLGKARQVRAAIEKASTEAKLNVIPVRRGCGSWECGCGLPHSLPFKVRGKCGSVKVELLPGPRGLGLVCGGTVKAVLKLAGIKDCWTRTFGSTSTTASMAFAVYDALKSTYKIVTPKDWAK